MTTPNHQAELLPCPFCGGAALIKRNKTVMVSCTNCTATTFQRLRDVSSAVIDWNMRPASHEAELVEALEKIERLAAPGQMLSLSDAIDALCDCWTTARAILAKVKAGAA